MADPNNQFVDSTPGAQQPGTATQIYAQRRLLRQQQLANAQKAGRVTPPPKLLPLKKTMGY